MLLRCRTEQPRPWGLHLPPPPKLMLSLAAHLKWWGRRGGEGPEFYYDIKQGMPTNLATATPHTCLQWRVGTPSSTLSFHSANPVGLPGPAHTAPVYVVWQRIPGSRGPSSR